MILKRTQQKNTLYHGQESVEIVGGQKVQIKVAGDVLLNEGCPAGYKWQVELDVRVRQVENE